MESEHGISKTLTVSSLLLVHSGFCGRMFHGGDVEVSLVMVVVMQDARCNSGHWMIHLNKCPGVYYVTGREYG